MIQKNPLSEDIISNVKFIDTNRRLATITTYDATYLATEDCWCVYCVRVSAVGYAARVNLNGVTIVSINSTTDTSGAFPVKKGQTVTTRDKDTGVYDISIYAMQN